MRRLWLTVCFVIAGCAPAVHPQCGVMGAEQDCNDEACVRCADHCGDECTALESNPPLFQCPDGESWSALTVCPSGG
ncbi:MAG: hypothetical protein Q8P41_12880 [Pseudomonadota bacterium]|nr:hypothetical protein [Pseudomonadota bacterium]